MPLFMQFIILIVTREEKKTYNNGEQRRKRNERSYICVELYVCYLAYLNNTMDEETKEKENILKKHFFGKYKTKQNKSNNTPNTHNRTAIIQSVTFL